MNCTKCGTKNDSDAEYCENCGSSLRPVCAHCGNPLKPGGKFCNKCGKPISTLPLPRGQEEHLAAIRKTAPPELIEKFRAASIKGEGERKPVTILFADIVGSTAIAEKLGPEEWKEVVSGAHQRISQAVYRYEGTIAQLLGDGVLAFFGAPITHEDDPMRAVQAAIDIQEAISDYAYELKGYVENFQLRIGLNTGTVVVGNIGSDLHLEYLAIGDAVNLAARLQSAAQPGKVLISGNTAQLVKTAFELHSLGEIVVKGKTNPITVFEVGERHWMPGGGRGFEVLVSPLVGRENELATLCGTLEMLRNGHGQIVAVMGEAGIGKSRLVEEAYQRTVIETAEWKPSPRSKLHWIEGRALSYGQALSFWTITQLIKNDLGLSDGDPEPRVRATLRKRIRELFGAQVDEVLPYLANLLGVKLEDEQAFRLQILDGETLKRQTLLSITRYFELIAREQPTVLVFEDLHWADPSSLQALQQLAALTDRAPIMLLLLFRPERDLLSWNIKLLVETDYPHRYTEISLQPLSAGEQNQLVDNLLAIADLPVDVRQLILERAEGNPFYLEEIVRSLIEQEGIVLDEGRWRVTKELHTITIPDTLQGVLLARIDRLQEDVRRTLQLAAVIGKSFLFSLLEAIAEAEQELDRHLALLQRVELVREKSRLPELEYMFKHSLTQEAAYNSLLIERRLEFHRRVGEALETLFAERKSEFLGLLAHHFEAANEREKAIDYLIQAGDRARLTDENSEALAFYQRAVELLEEAGDVRGAARVWLKLGQVQHVNFQFDAACQAYEKAFFLQQKSIPHRSLTTGLPAHTLRTCHPTPHVTLDPGKVSWLQDFRVITNLFSGLVKIDVELNILPDVAHSWQVLDGGKLYRFHLRNDIFWTDGTTVKAQDFVWAWKRNLNPVFCSETASYLYDVVGARDFHQGHCTDPDSIGVRALDELTLEIFLDEPAAYFPFILSLPVAYPLPGAIIETYGDAWWQAGYIVSNGAFRLVEFKAGSGGAMERNPRYHGEFPGNIQRVEWMIIPNPTDRVRLYRENCTDLAYMLGREDSSELPAGEKYEVNLLFIRILVAGVNSRPFDDQRVRKALSLALDRSELRKRCDLPLPGGGLIPPGIPGHSPDIGEGFDLVTARRLLAEAGFPDGQGFQKFTGVAPEAALKIAAEITRQWQTHLGIKVDFEGFNPQQMREMKNRGIQAPWEILGLVPDYPDPDCILNQVDLLENLHYEGWQDAAYDQLVETAARTTDRVKRMAMYRQADRFLVDEQALALPLSYTSKDCVFRKPWVKNYQISSLGRELYQNVIVAAH